MSQVSYDSNVSETVMTVSNLFISLLTYLLIYSYTHSFIHLLIHSFNGVYLGWPEGFAALLGPDHVSVAEGVSTLQLGGLHRHAFP